VENTHSAKEFPISAGLTGDFVIGGHDRDQDGFVAITRFSSPGRSGVFLHRHVGEAVAYFWALAGIKHSLSRHAWMVVAFSGNSARLDGEVGALGGARGENDLLGCADQFWPSLRRGFDTSSPASKGMIGLARCEFLLKSGSISSRPGDLGVVAWLSIGNGQFTRWRQCAVLAGELGVSFVPGG